MDHTTRYAFCLEMAQKAEANEQHKAANQWYARAWHFLLKDTDYENMASMKDFWEVYKNA